MVYSQKVNVHLSTLPLFIFIESKYLIDLELCGCGWCSPRRFFLLGNAMGIRYLSNGKRESNFQNVLCFTILFRYWQRCNSIWFDMIEQWCDLTIWLVLWKCTYDLHMQSEEFKVFFHCFLFCNWQDSCPWSGKLRFSQSELLSSTVIIPMLSHRTPSKSKNGQKF